MQQYEHLNTGFYRELLEKSYLLTVWINYWKKYDLLPTICFRKEVSHKMLTEMDENA